MKTLRGALTAIGRLFKRYKTEANKIDSNDFEFTHAKFGLNLKETSNQVPNSLFHQMYSKENEMLFI